MSKSKYNHLNSKAHKSFDEPIKRRYFILSPVFDQIEKKLKKYINIYIKIYGKYSVS